MPIMNTPLNDFGPFLLSHLPNMWALGILAFFVALVWVIGSAQRDRNTIRRSLR